MFPGGVLCSVPLGFDRWLLGLFSSFCQGALATSVSQVPATLALLALMGSA
jgi:hypothetical protein